MSPGYYVAVDTKWEGPFTVEQLRSFVSKGLLELDTPCCSEPGKESKSVEHYIGFVPRIGSRSTSAQRTSVTLLGLLSVLLVIGGMAGTVYFYLFFDPSVVAPSVTVQYLGIQRINNMGLLQDRQNGLIISLAALVLGVVIAIFDSIQRHRK